MLVGMVLRFARNMENTVAGAKLWSSAIGEIKSDLFHSSERHRARAKGRGICVLAVGAERATDEVGKLSSGMFAVGHSCRRVCLGAQCDRNLAKRRGSTAECASEVALPRGYFETPSPLSHHGPAGQSPHRLPSRALSLSGRSSSVQSLTWYPFTHTPPFGPHPQQSSW